jgi:hypothetical protein
MIFNFFDPWIIELNHFAGFIKDEMVVLFEEIGLFELRIIGPELMPCDQSAVQ